MEIQYEIIGKRIRQRRKELNMKQYELAELLDISNNHMSAIENGREKPSLELLMNICDHLNVTPDFLLLGCIRANNVPQNIIDNLNRCSRIDYTLIDGVIQVFVEHNKSRSNPPDSKIF